jgi:hypothetical protein
MRFRALLIASCAFAQVAPVPMDLPNTPGPSRSQIGPGARVAWMTGIQPLGDPMRHNDFPSSAAASNGDIWVVWSSYSGLREEIHARFFRGSHWYATFPIPGVQGDVWMPQVAIDAKGRPWFVWSQLVDYPSNPGERPNWDLFATCYENGQWLNPQRLTSSPGPDVNHRFIADSKGTLWVVWQSFRDGQSDIFLLSSGGASWSPETRISTSPANDWYPDIAVDSQGNPSVVWDTYASGNYDVRLRSMRAGQWNAEVAVAETPTGEAAASAVYDRQDRLWIAYEDLGMNWGKDTGGRSLGVKQYGMPLGSFRQIRVKVLAGGQWMQPAGDLAKVLPANVVNWMASPRLYADPEGRVWLLYRHLVSRYATWTWAIDSEHTPNAANYRVLWQTYATYYNGDAWLTSSELPRSKDRASSTMSAATAPNGQTWVFWHTDTRDDTQPHVPFQNQIWSAVLTPASRPGPLQFVPYQQPAPQSAAPSPSNEAADLAALRSQSVTLNGRPYKLYKGDLHRHTELSTDGGGRTDGSILDFFRYMIDAAGMDYGAITDHSAGGDAEYWWWLIQKVTDMYQVPGRYASLFGYERTPHWPKGHKNVIHAVRNVPIVKFFFRPDVPEHWSTYAVIAGDLVENDTRLLYDEVRRSGGIAIPHTLATSQGNDWTDTDEKVQPVAEIYQGARSSYEHEGAPGGHRKRPNVERDTEYNPAGFIWNAWQKGVRIGVIASSDHTSTHLSFAMVYSADSSRAGVIEAIRQRRTYGATDNILLEFWMGDHFMGEEFRASTPPDMRVKVRGTAPVAKVSIIRGGRFLTTMTPNTQDVSFTFRDTSPQSGASWYYVRVEQADGQLAWSTPIWVNR